MPEVTWRGAELGCKFIISLIPKVLAVEMQKGLHQAGGQIQGRGIPPRGNRWPAGWESYTGSSCRCTKERVGAIAQEM